MVAGVCNFMIMSEDNWESGSDERVDEPSRAFRRGVRGVVCCVVCVVCVLCVCVLRALCASCAWCVSCVSCVNRLCVCVV